MATIENVIYPVSDLAAAKAVFTALLGADPVVDEPYYVQFGSDGFVVGLAPKTGEGPAGPVPYWRVDDLDASVAALVAAGASVVSPAREVGGGRRVAVVADADGNPVGLLADAS